MRWVLVTAVWAAMALLLGLVAAALLALLRSGGFTGQLETVLPIVGLVVLGLGLLALTAGTASERKRWLSQREAVTQGPERSGRRLDLKKRTNPVTVTFGIVLGALGLLAVSYPISAAVNSSKRAEAAKPYKLVVEKPAAEAAHRAGVDLERIVARSTERVFALVPHPKQVKIIVRLDPKSTVPEIGIGAAPGPGRGEIVIALDERSKTGFRRSLITWLPASLARILFLNSRVQAGPGYGLTLGDALVSEGLSDHFVAEAFPKTPPQPWDHRPMTKRQEAGIWKRAKIDLIIPGSYDHSDWFAGTEARSALPHWSGYTFAYRLVGPYLAAGRRASRAVETEAPAVYEPYAKAHTTSG